MENISERKPGVMVYFEMRSLLERLSNNDAGILFRAIMDYGATGCIPELPESLFIAWPLIQMRLDMDNERYWKVTNQRKYATYSRWAKEKGNEPIPYNDWLCNMAEEGVC